MKVEALFLFLPFSPLWAQQGEIITLPEESPEMRTLICQAVASEAGSRPAKVWFRPQGNFYNVKIALHPGSDETAVYRRIPVKTAPKALTKEFAPWPREESLGRIWVS